MPYLNISFLETGLQAIDTKKYNKWFKLVKGFKYESGDVEMHYKDREFDLPDGNARRWDYIIIRLKNGILQRVVFVEPHPIRRANVLEVLEKLAWLRCQINSQADLQHFKKTDNEYYWIYHNSNITPNSKERRMCNVKGLRLTSIPLIV